MRYDGGKGRCYQQLINLMPPHRRYVETHLGGGAVMRHKRPAIEQIGIELDSSVVQQWRERWPKVCRIIQGDAVDQLARMALDDQTVVYVDPPYYPNTRRRTRVYRCDYTNEDHERLLECITSLPCKVLVSGYPCDLYERRLAGWSVHRFRAKTHVDVREEWVWFNFQRSPVLHDDRFLGDGFREREVVRRRQERLRRRIRGLTPQEQSGLHGWLGGILNGETA